MDVPTTGMMVNQIYSTLLVLIATLMIVGLSSKKLRIPTVLGFIIAGVLIGPHGLKIISKNYLVSLFAETGASLLLFLIGMEFSFSKIIELGIKPIIATIVEMGLAFF